MVSCDFKINILDSNIYNHNFQATAVAVMQCEAKFLEICLQIGTQLSINQALFCAKAAGQQCMRTW